jgi:SAM-dependent methyltransferase
VDIVKENNCRACGNELADIYYLGNIFPSGFVKDGEQPCAENKAPLQLCKCKNCGLIQLRHTVNLDLMYRQYWYSSSLNKSMISSLKDIVNDIESRIVLKDYDTVVDIGCNDGTLLSLYSNKNLITVGFDPALNLKRPGCSYFYNDYFNADGFLDLKGHTKAKVVTAVAMFYDLPDPKNFLKNVKDILSDDGLFIVQFTDLTSMIKATAFDNVCHEHLEYYRLIDVVNLLQKNGLAAIDVSYNDVNGGSLRVVAGHSSRYVLTGTVIRALQNEAEYLKPSIMDTFSSSIEKAKGDLDSFLNIASLLGHTVYLLGASTKGNTLLQICNVTDKKVRYAAEVNKDKFGLRTVGSNIKIISEDEALERQPDYFIVPVWHFEKNLLTKEPIRKYIKNGGKLVFPLPTFHIIGKDDLKDD